MKNIIMLVKSYFRQNSLGVAISIASGIVLCFLINLMGGYIKNSSLSKIRVGVIDYDESVLSSDFKSYLAGDLDYELIENADYEYLADLLIDKSISSIIEIPEGFYDAFASGNDGKIVITYTDDFENAAFLEAYMNSYLSGVKLLSAGAGGNKGTFDIYLSEYKSLETPVSKAKAYEIDLDEVSRKESVRNTFGFVLQIIFALGVIISFMLIEDKANGIYNRITVTPVKPAHYIAGICIYGLILSLIMSVIYCSYIFLWKIDIGFSVIKLFLLLMLLAFFVICFVVDASILLKSKSTASSMIVGFSTVGATLGGAYFDIDIAPKSLQNMARALPQFWFMDTVRILMNNPAADVTPNVIILVLFSVLAFLIGAVLFSQSYKNA